MLSNCKSIVLRSIDSMIKTLELDSFEQYSTMGNAPKCPKCGIKTCFNPYSDSYKCIACGYTKHVAELDKSQNYVSFKDSVDLNQDNKYKDPSFINPSKDNYKSWDRIKQLSKKSYGKYDSNYEAQKKRKQRIEKYHSYIDIIGNLIKMDPYSMVDAKEMVIYIMNQDRAMKNLCGNCKIEVILAAVCLYTAFIKNNALLDSSLRSDLDNYCSGKLTDRSINTISPRAEQYYEKTFKLKFNAGYIMEGE